MLTYILIIVGVLVLLYYSAMLGASLVAMPRITLKNVVFAIIWATILPLNVAGQASNMIVEFMENNCDD